MFKRLLYSSHRVLGTILSILFLIWFLSGFVMIYHSFPQVGAADRWDKLDPLSSNLIPLDSLDIPTNDWRAIELKSLTHNPTLYLSSKDTTYTLSVNGREVESVDIWSYAKRWSMGSIAKVDTMYHLDQWNPFSSRRDHFPLYKFYFDDPEKHQLYVSSHTGEALQFTSQSSRIWAWLGAIPHWVYFTSLRQDLQLWKDVVIALSGIGAIMCLVGGIWGVDMYIKTYRRKRKWASPYKKIAYKWHHILGFIFGFFVFTFVFSGMMSLYYVPQWLVPVQSKEITVQLQNNKPLPFDSYKGDYTELITRFPEQIKSIQWSRFGNIPVYKVAIDGNIQLFDASTPEVQPFVADEHRVRQQLDKILSSPYSIQLLDKYDNYYVHAHHKLPLPVYKVEVADADCTTYYINPENGNIRTFNTNSRIQKWLYGGLHSFNIKFLVDRPILWNLVMWITMLGGTLVSGTGVWLSIQYLRRKVKKK